MRRRALLEPAAVVATGAVHFLFENFFDAKAAFIAAAAPLWIAYVAYRLKTVPGQGRAWGFRLDTLRPAGLACAAASVAAAAAMVAYGSAQGRLPPPRTFWLILALYPLWGLVQQFLLGALLARNLREFLPPAAVVPAAALLFGLAHAPDWTLSALAFAAALVWIPIYLWRPNLWVLGISHGMLGALAYYAVLGRDAWAMPAG